MRIPTCTITCSLFKDVCMCHQYVGVGLRPRDHQSGYRVSSRCLILFVFSHVLMYIKDTFHTLKVMFILGGLNICFIFNTKIGEMIQFDQVFPMG